jgi:hypothetical protein
VELEPAAGVSVALVRLTWKNKTDTPEGGSSVMVSETGAEPAGGGKATEW